MKKESRKREKTWGVDVTRYIYNTECPAREKRGNKWWCIEIDEKCCEKKCIGCEDFI